MSVVPCLPAHLCVSPQRPVAGPPRERVTVSRLPLRIVLYACRLLKPLARQKKLVGNFSCRDVECGKQHLHAVKETLGAAYKSQKVSKQTTRKPTVSLRTPTQMTEVLISEMNGTTCLQGNGRDTIEAGYNHTLAYYP